MADRPRPHDPVTYAENRADLDSRTESIESRIRETEARILDRLDRQDRNSERLADRAHEQLGKLEDRIRDAEKKITTLQAADAMLWRCLGALATVIPLVFAAIEYFKR